jgi:hypothetical protein
MDQIRAMTNDDVPDVHNSGQRHQLTVAMSWNPWRVRTPAGSQR